MKEYQITVEEPACTFYQKIADTAGLSIEQVMADCLFRYAGELSIQMIQEQ